MFKLFEAVFQVLFDFKHRLSPDGLAANMLEVLVSHGDALQILQTAFQERLGLREVAHGISVSGRLGGAYFKGIQRLNHSGFNRLTHSISFQDLSPKKHRTLPHLDRAELRELHR